MVKPRFMTPEDVRLPEEDNKSYDQSTDDFTHESFTLSRPPREARIPEGTHVATVEKVRQTKEPAYEHPEVMQDKVIVLFSTQYGTLQKHMNLSFHPKSILGQFFVAVLGESPININSDDLVGKQLRITIVHEEKGGDTWERIPKEGGFKRMK